MVGRNSPESPNPSWPADDAPPDSALMSACRQPLTARLTRWDLCPRLPSGRLAAWLSFGAACARCIPAVAVAQP